MIKYVDDITAYSFDMVNCFERPVAILLENEKKNLGRLFLICNALAMSYYDENYIINNGICFESVDSILKITLRKDIVNNSLDMVIDKYVELGKAVLVPGNLKYLFYSEHFMGNDWKHLFLVTGINPVKKTVHIIDSEHVNYDNEKIIYKDFNLTQEILMECFEHYLWSDEEKYVYHFDYNEIDIIEKLKEILRILESKICSRNYSQDYLITTLNNSMEERDELEKLLINSAKYKFVLLYELVFVLKNYNIDTYNLTILNKKLYDVWSNKILGIVKRERKHNYANVVFKDIKEINNLEVELLGTVKKIHKCLENNLYCAEINEKSYFINNEDKIIKPELFTDPYLNQ